MEFFTNLINNIYAFVLGILKNAGVPVEDLPKEIIPTTDAE